VRPSSALPGLIRAVQSWYQLPLTHISEGAGMADVFANLPPLMSTDDVAAFSRTTKLTIYDWHYRPDKYRVPPGMIIKFGRKMLIDRDIFKVWFQTRRD
jgi:hypothetical protein